VSSPAEKYIINLIVVGEDTNHGGTNHGDPNNGTQFKYWFLIFLSCTGKYLLFPPLMSSPAGMQELLGGW